MVVNAAPVVSVLLPVWNAGATLPVALESLAAQTERDWELIAVDDGSTDGSLTILEQAAARDPRVRVLSGPHRGLVPALGRALDAARSPLVARMDADDVALPQRLEVQRRYLAGHPDVGLVATCAIYEGDRTRYAGYARFVDWTNTVLTHAQIVLAAFIDSPIVHPSVMFRRELVQRFGGYADGPFPEDHELWLRWLEAGVRMEKLAEPLLVWRDHPARTSRRDPRYGVDAVARMKAGYLARWLARHNPHHPEIVVWGAGRRTRQRARPLAEHGLRISAFIDIDPDKIGARLDGAPVIAPDALPPPGRCFVVSCVSNCGARDEIRDRLDACGYRAGVDYLLAA